MAFRPQVTKKIVEETKTDAVIALAGAEYIREKLYSLFDMGPDPISRMAYAVKVRVKSDERLEKKVLDRRFVRGKPDYRASHVTDIVGVRLIGVYSDSLRDICRRLFEIIEFAQLPNIKLFKGSRLQDCINEIIVYTSNNSSPVYRLLYDWFLTLNLPLRPDRRPRVELQPPNDLKPYSSVHILLNALSYSTKSTRIIPVEIQVRTIFEDAWAEVDHPLVYKGSEFETALGKKKQDKKVEYDSFYNDAKVSVRHLKHSLDLLSQEVDSLKGRFLKIDEYFGFQKKRRPGIRIRIDYARHDLVHLQRRAETPDPIHLAETPGQIKKRLTRLNGQIAKYYEQPRDKVELKWHIDQLTKIINDASTLMNNYSSKYRDLFSADHDARYFLFMEIALALLWRYKIVDDANASKR